MGQGDANQGVQVRVGTGQVAPIQRTGTHVQQDPALNALQQQQQQQQQQRMVPGSAGDILQHSSPLMRNTVDMDEVSDLKMPDAAMLREHYEKAGIELQDSSWKRRRRLDESIARHDLQADLRRKRQRMPRPAGLEHISMKDAMKLSDKQLVERYGRYSVGGYLAARYQLLLNNYHMVLPEKEMKSMPRHEIMKKLRELYDVQGQPRNAELIRYFQALIIVRDLEEAEAEKENQAQAQPVQVLELPSREELEKQNDSAVKKLNGVISESFLTDEQMKKRKSVMKSVLVPDGKQQSWRGNDDSLDDTRKEGIRRVLAWMYRNCCKSGESKEPFVYRLTRASNEQLLFMFYLIENDRMKAPSTDAYYTAITDYVPDVERFKSRVVSSRWKFWKRIGKNSSDNVINWNKLSAAATYVLKNDVISDHIRYERREQHEQTRLNDPANSSDEKKREIYFSLLQAKGNLLITMYRSAGLSQDMPPQLIKDPKLRRKVMDTMEDFRLSSLRLLEIIERSGAGDGRRLQNAGNYESDQKEADGPAEGVEDEVDIMGGVANTKNITDSLSSAESIVTSLSFFRRVNNFSETTSFEGAFGGLTGVSAVLGAITSIGAAYSLHKGANALSAADYTAQIMSVSGDVIDSTNALVEGGSHVVGLFTDLGDSGNSMWLAEDTVVRTAGDAFSSVAGGIQFVSGCVSMGVGALQTAAGAIQYRRQVSSSKDVQRSKRRLYQKGKLLTTDRQALQRFLDHQDRNIADKKFSAGISMASGCTKIVAGALMVSGILAPIGGIVALAGTIVDIGAGVLYGRYRRRKTKMAAVDDALKIDQVVKSLRDKSDRAKNTPDHDLKKAIRQEALGELGYSNFNQFFSEICKQNAMMLYRHVFEIPKTDPDYMMYLDALRSLGTKIVIPERPGEKPFPTVDVIYSRLME